MMGADLISAVAVWPKDAKLDFDAGKKAAETVTQEDIPVDILDGALGYDLDYDDEGDLTAEGISEFRESLANAIQEVRSMIDNHWHNTVQYTLFGHTVFFLGDVSWGDSPEGYDELIAVLEVEKVAKAIGFRTDCYQ